MGFCRYNDLCSHVCGSEVNAINKQKFLAELGKLLTFMYEEDRQTALAMYVKMFEDAEDEQALIQALISPTRQAVIVARAYNAKERKLQVEAQSREDLGEVDDEATPDFVLAIDQIYQSAIPLHEEASAPLADQFSLFEEAELFEEEEIASPPEEQPLPDDGAAADAVLPEAAEEPPAEPAEALPVEEAAAAAPAEGVAKAEESVPAPEADESPEQSAGDEVDDFLMDFSIENDELAQIDEPEEARQEASAAEALPEEEALREAQELPPEKATEEEAPPAEALDGRQSAQGVRKAVVPLLILFILLAVPITLVCVALLLIPALLLLAVAVGVISIGSATLMGAFGGFPVFADIMIVLGLALILLALGLLVLWIFVWFIGGPIVGLIRGVISLGARWCYKEVAA